MLFVLSRVLEAPLLGYRPPEEGEELEVDLRYSLGEYRLLWRLSAPAEFAARRVMEVECGRDIGKIRSSVSYPREW